MDAGFNQYKAKFGVFVGTITLHVLANRHRLLDEHVEVLRNLRCETILFQQT